MLVQQIQKLLLEEVNKNIYYYIKVEWMNNMGSIHIYTKMHLLNQTIEQISNNYSKYYKKEYKMNNFIIEYKRNKNPHFNIG
jgi:hypothetical protein